MSETKTTIIIEAVDKTKLPVELQPNLHDLIVTIRNGEKMCTLLRPNAELRGEVVHVHQDGLAAADLPKEVMDHEINVTDLEFLPRLMVTLWIYYILGAGAYEDFPDLIT